MAAANLGIIVEVSAGVVLILAIAEDELRGRDV